MSPRSNSVGLVELGVAEAGRVGRSPCTRASRGARASSSPRKCVGVASTNPLPRRSARTKVRRVVGDQAGVPLVGAEQREGGEVGQVEALVEQELVSRPPSLGTDVGGELGQGHVWAPLSGVRRAFE
jgi:hypothetical protein